MTDSLTIDPTKIGRMTRPILLSALACLASVAAGAHIGGKPAPTSGSVTTTQTGACGCKGGVYVSETSACYADLASAVQAAQDGYVCACVVCVLCVCVCVWEVGVGWGMGEGRGP